MSEQMDSKTCPHCQHEALRLWSRDSWLYRAWECTKCDRVFWTDKNEDGWNVRKEMM